jgi:hypothetical protein
MILALTRITPPEHTGLSHWSAREMAKYLKRDEESMSRTPSSQTSGGKTTFDTKTIDVVGLYLDPPEDAVVLSIPWSKKSSPR